MGLDDLELRALALPGDAASAFVRRIGWSEVVMPQRLDVADVIEQCAGDLHSVAFDFREPARSIAYAEQRIARLEQVLSRAREAVRGRS